MSLPYPGDAPVVQRRELDPTRSRTSRALTTWYVPDRIVVSGPDRDGQRELLSALAERLGWRLEPDATFGTRDEPGTLRPGNPETAVTRLLLRAEPGAADVDAFTLLEAVRATRWQDRPTAEPEPIPWDPADPVARIALDHVVFLSSFQPNPRGFYGTNGWSPNPRGFYGTNGLDSPADTYALPGSGGRVPVAVVIGEPARGEEPREGRRAAVGIVDSGVGDHPWLRAVIQDLPGPSGESLAPAAALRPSPELAPDQCGPADGVLDAVAGHGTFIAGVVRQSAPAADIYSWRVVAGDGAIAETDLVATLEGVADLVEAAWVGKPGAPLDVLSLSLGYYHERPEDAANDLLLLPTIARLSKAGVSVVVSAGNESTDRPRFPAAFAVLPAAAPGAPVIAVGARNPNGTIALFSNIGSWVTCYVTGAAVVSTSPPFEGSEQPAARLRGVRSGLGGGVGGDAVTRGGDAVARGGVAGGGVGAGALSVLVDGTRQRLNDVAELRRPRGEVRETLDPDSYVGGFAVWSGTSFAAPLLAGRIAAAIAAQGPVTSGDAATAIKVAQEAVAVALRE